MLMTISATLNRNMAITKLLIVIHPMLGPDIQAVILVRQETTIISENDMDAINFTIFAKIFAITHCYSNYYLYLCERNPRIILETTNNTNN